MSLYIAPIVEGETEERCIKIILSRLWRELLGATAREELCILEPNQANRSSLLKSNHREMEEKIEQSYRRIKASIRNPNVDRGLVAAA